MENGYEELITERSLMYEYIYLETTQLYLTEEHGEVSSGCPFCGAEYTKPFRI